jgi:GxxExxY protein
MLFELLIAILMNAMNTQSSQSKGNSISENELSRILVGIAINVHKKIGPGLLESSYQEVMFYEIEKAGLYVEKEKPLPLIYDEIKLNVGYRVDLMVENKLIIEVKAVESIHPIHFAQLLTYLRHSGCKLGLLMNFHETKMANGIKRVVNGL